MKALYVVWICYLFLTRYNVITADAQSSNECVASERVSHTACVDYDADVCTERRHECDSDPSYVLIHCRKTCRVCLEDDSTLSQDAGIDKIPMEISIQVLQVVRQTNLYYQSLHIPNYSLVSCRDKSEMCAFWAFQEQCTNSEYRDFMERECIVTCQQCELLHARAFLKFLLEDLQQAYNSHKDDLLASRKASLSLLMETLGMDPSLIGNQPLDPNAADTNNWAEELHSRLQAVTPPALLRLYDSPQGPINDSDLALLTALHGFPPDTPRDVVLTNSLVKYRSRGYIVSIMQNVDHLITRPIQLLVGFAIPNNASMKRLKQVSPLIQMGAGSGFWAGILRQHNVDVLAYDLHPSSLQDNTNEFFDAAYIDDIHEGACVDSLTLELARSRTLLLIWPNDPDPVDNKEYCQDDGCQGSETVWDADCLEAYVHAGGRRVVFVGEREATISGDSSADCGLSATRRFQDLLEKKFVLVDTISIPNWWLNEDDMTIWERK